MLDIYVENGVRYRNLDFAGTPYYRVGEDGSFWSRKTNSGKLGDWKRIAKSRDSEGYCKSVRVKHDMNGIPRKYMSVTHLMLEAFVGPRPEGMECCHNDGNKYNDVLSNIRWDTHENNELDKKKHGTYHWGEGNKQSRFKNEEILEIRRLYATGEYTQWDIAKMFGTSQGAISNIVLKECWKHI